MKDIKDELDEQFMKCERARSTYEEGWYYLRSKKDEPWRLVQIKLDANDDPSIDGVRCTEETGVVRPAFDPSAPLLTIERACLVTARGETPKYSPFGYVIAEDGTTYAMTERWTHGVVVATLYPDLAKQHGFAAPVAPISENDVFLYQAFELGVGRELPLVRIATGGYAGNVNVATPNEGVTRAQIDATRLALAEYGMTLQDEVHTEDGDVSLRQILKDLEGQLRA